MGYAWIDDVQHEIDEVGLENYLNEQGIYDVWTSYESCLCQITLEGEEIGEVFATIAAPGMLTNAGYQAFLIYDAGGFFAVENLSDGIVSIEDGFLSFGLDADVCGILLNTECAFLLTSDNPAKITSLQVVRIEPAGAVLTFDLAPPSPIKLSTPTGLNADNITSNSARTNWQAVENASNYKVQYKAAGDTVWTETFTD